MSGTGHVLAMLRDLLEWKLPPSRWEQVESILTVLRNALDDDDSDAVREAAIALESAGPVRISRIGAIPPEPAPPEVLDRANHLIHVLSGATLRRMVTDPRPAGARAANSPVRRRRRNSARGVRRIPGGEARHQDQHEGRRPRQQPALTT